MHPGVCEEFPATDWRRWGLRADEIRKNRHAACIALGLQDLEDFCAAQGSILLKI